MVGGTTNLQKCSSIKACNICPYSLSLDTDFLKVFTSFVKTLYDQAMQTKHKNNNMLVSQHHILQTVTEMVEGK